MVRQWVIALILCLSVSLPVYATVELDNDNNQAIDISRGGTNSTTATGAKANLGLGNVDNTSDLDKPISILTQSALNGKSDLLVGLAIVNNETELLAAEANGSVNSILLNSSFSMTQDITLTKPFSIAPGAIITTTGYSLTINGPFSAGDYQVFSGSGTVTELKESRPEWFTSNTIPGTMDMTSAITSAIASVTASYGKVILDSYYLISGNISVPDGVTVEGLGSSGTRIYKDVSMTGNGITMDGFNSRLIGVNVLADLGATGDCVQIANANVVLRDVVAHGAGKGTVSGNGIRIGKDAASNCNNWLLDNVSVRGMSGHGIYVSDKNGSAPDANSGTAIKPEVEDCGGDGIFEENAYSNTYIGTLIQGCVNGIHFGGGSYYSAIIGGDRENNSNKDILIDAPTGLGSANLASISSVRIGEIITDNGVGTRRLERLVQKQGTWTPVVAGATTPGTQTYTKQWGWYHRNGDMVTVSGAVTMSAKDVATAGSIRITGLPISCATITNGVFPGSVQGWAGFTFPAGFTTLQVYTVSGQSYVGLTRSGSAKTSSVAVDASEVSLNTTTITFSITYPISDFQSPVPLYPPQ